MRLYLKLAMMIAAAVVIQSALRPVGRGAWEVQFAARCWLAYHLQDAELEARLVQEGQEQLAQDLRRAWEAQPALASVHASAARPAFGPRRAPPSPGGGRSEEVSDVGSASIAAIARNGNPLLAADAPEMLRHWTALLRGPTPADLTRPPAQ